MDEIINTINNNDIDFKSLYKQEDFSDKELSKIYYDSSRIKAKNKKDNKANLEIGSLLKDSNNN